MISLPDADAVPPLLAVIGIFSSWGCVVVEKRIPKWWSRERVAGDFWKEET
jgi:hypothetical protein